MTKRYMAIRLLQKLKWNNCLATRRWFKLIGVGGLLLLISAFALISFKQPQPSYLLLDRHGYFLADVGNAEQGYGYWPVVQLPPRVVAATLALEDRRFAWHPGVDPVAIVRAVVSNFSQGKRVSGASTLAMQVARMQAPQSRSYWHKLLETVAALVLTTKYGQDAVLKQYLRLVPYGNNIHGIAYAARRYLDKPVSDLSWAEIAFLTAIPQSPTQMNPYHENGRLRAIQRGKRILQQLQKQQVLSAADYELAMSQIQNLYIAPLPTRDSSFIHAVFKLQNILAKSSPLSSNEPYRITTTLDQGIQRQAQQAMLQTLNSFTQQGADQAALILLDRHNNQVLAWLGSADYFDTRYAGAIDYTQTKRSPGSTLKPFIYAQAFEQKLITPASILDDLPSESNGIRNADRNFLGPLLPRQALANSRNIPVAALLNRLGMDDSYHLFESLGLHHNDLPAETYGLGLATGALPVSLEAVVTAYTTFTNDGLLKPLVWYQGQSQPAQFPRLFAQNTMRSLSLMLSDPVARLPTFPRMGPTEYPFPVALKTGTSQGMRDAWTIAYSSRYLLGVWIGNPDARPMKEITGGVGAAAIAQRVLLTLHQAQNQGLADINFDPPSDYTPVRICARTGKRATAACDLSFEEWFAPDQIPTEDDDSHIQIAIDTRNGERAHAATPTQFIANHNFVNLPPRYAEWAANNGLQLLPIAATHASSQNKQPITDNLPASVTILSPHHGDSLILDPTVPAAMSTIALRAEVSNHTREILWVIDGKPYQLTSPPYQTRWPLKTGQHTIEAWIPYTNVKSKAVYVRVE